MRRWVSLLLLVLLPLQLTWAAAAGYCRHETAPQAAQHFGHHQHAHVDAASADAPGAPAASDDGGGAGLAGVDADCACCHFAAAQALPAAIAVPGAPPGHTLPAHPAVAKPRLIASPLERPDWHPA